MTNKIYVGNLPFSFDDAALKKLFEEIGEIAESVVIKDRFSGRSKGFGFVTFANKEDVKKAIAELNGEKIEGREIRVSEAKPMSER